MESEDNKYMVEIICQGESPSEARAKCMAAKILLTEILPTEKISTDTIINILNAIGGVYITESGDKEHTDEKDN